MYEMLVGQLPFDGENDEEVFQAILTKPIDGPSDVSVSEILLGLLNRNRSERFGCSTNRTFDIRQRRWFSEPFFSFAQLEEQKMRSFYIPSERKDFSQFSLKRMEISANVSQLNATIFERF